MTELFIITSTFTISYSDDGPCNEGIDIKYCNTENDTIKETINVLKNMETTLKQHNFDISSKPHFEFNNIQSFNELKKHYNVFCSYYRQLLSLCSCYHAGTNIDLKIVKLIIKDCDIQKINYI